MGDVPWQYDDSQGILTFTAGGTLTGYAESPWNNTAIEASSVKKIIFTAATNAPSDASYLFGTGNTSTGLTSLTAIEGLNLLDTSKVTTMYYMFNFIGVTSLDLSAFDTSQVTTMEAMLANARQLTTVAVTNFNTEKVSNFIGMFYHNYQLRALDLTSFNMAASSTTTNFFNGDSELRELTLGSQLSLATSMSLPAISTSSGDYTGAWVGTSSNNNGKIYSSSTDLLTNYSAAYSGKYVWQTTTSLESLEVTDSTIKTTDSWSGKDNFVRATDENGIAVNFSEVTFSGSVNVKVAGSYQITYGYGDLTKTVTVTVEDVPATLKLEFLQGDQILNEYSLNLTNYRVWDQIDLNQVTELNTTITKLQNNYYSVTAPQETTITLESPETTVKYAVSGSLNISAPKHLDFGSISYTGKKQTLSVVDIDTLSVVDTLATGEETGWSVYANVSTPLTNILTNQEIVGGSFSYLNNQSENISLSSVNQLIADSSSGGSQDLAADWGTNNQSPGLKLNLEPNVGAGEYAGIITWTVQTGPESS